MKQRHYRKHGVAARHGHDVGRNRRVGMQHGRAVIVEHPFRVTRRPRRVAQRGCRALVEVRPLEVAGLVPDQGFVTHSVLEFCLGHVLLVGHDDKTLDIWDVVRDRLEQRHEHDVGKDPAILGMVDDENQLLREQSRVDRVADVARPADAVIGLDVPVVVPCKRRDSVARIRTQPGERIGELPGAIDTIPIGITMTRIVGCH